MKIVYALSIGSILFLLFSTGCKPEGTTGEKYDVNGTVYLINSDTPVPNALVRFFKDDTSNNVWSQEVLEEVGSAITDENGRFAVPNNIKAEFVRAYGLISIFNYEAESGDAYLDGYLQGQGDIALYLKPPAWVKVKAVDIEPLNPEIIAVKADTFPGSAGLITISTGFRKWQEVGNINTEITYLFVDENLNFSPVLHYQVGSLSAFDTTEVVIPY